MAEFKINLDKILQDETFNISGPGETFRVDLSKITGQEPKDVVEETKKEVEEPDENDVGTIESVLNGIASGIIKIPEGVASLGASLYDLGADTNTAAKVEEWFDKVNIFDEKADATVAGKITETLVNLGIPGGVAFTKGASLANKVLRSKKLGKYFTVKNPALKEAGDIAIDLNKKGKIAKYGTASLAGGVADAIAVGDVDEVGTFGDMLGGPTELNRNQIDDPMEEIVNRIKFGTESALFSGLIGGVGNIIKRLATRGEKLARSNKTTDRILSKIYEAVTPAGKKGKLAYESEQFFAGAKKADLNNARRISESLAKDVDSIFPFYRNIFNPVRLNRRTVTRKKFNEALISGTPKYLDVNGKELTGAFKKSQVAKVLIPKIDKATRESLKTFVKKTGGNTKNLDQALNKMDAIRTGKLSELFTDLGQLIKPRQWKEFQQNFETKWGDWLSSTYDILEKPALLPFYQANKATEQNLQKFIKAIQEVGKKKGKDIPYSEAEFYASRAVETAEIPKGITFSEKRFPGATIAGEPFFVQNSLMDSLNSKTRMSIKVLEPELQRALNKALGKIEDPVLTTLSGVERLSTIVRKNQYFDDLLRVSDDAKIKNPGEGGLFFDTAGQAGAVFGKNVALEPLNMDPNKFYDIGGTNPLNGKYTSVGLKEALEEGQKNLINNKTLAFIYDSFILYPKAASQIAKTILSPITHARNLFSATSFMFANGFIPGVTVSPGDMASAFKTSFNAIRQGGKEGQELYEKLLRAGVVDSSVTYGDLSGLLKDIKFGEGLTNLNFFKFITKPFLKIGKVAGDLYTAEDDLIKIMTFSMERQRYDRAFRKAFRKANVPDGDAFIEIPGMNPIKLGSKEYDDYLFDVSANLVKNNVPNYARVGQLVKDIRRAPVGNFVSFPAEIMRTSTGIIDTVLKERAFTIPIKDATGKIISEVKPLNGIAMKRLIGFGTTVAVVPYTTVEMFKTIYDITDEQLESMRRFVADWSKNSTLLPMKDDKGDYYTIDFSHANAYDTVIRPIQTVINAVAEGREDNDGIMDDFMIGLFRATKELGEPFISESIWFEAAADIIIRKGQTRDGKTLYTEKTPYSERVSAIIDHLITSFTPGSIPAFERIDYAITAFDTPLQGKKGKYDERGNTYELGYELAGIVGLRPVKLDPERGMRYKLFEYNTNIGNSRREFTSKLLTGGPVNPSDIVDRFQISNQAAYNTKKKLFKDYWGALQLGVDQETLDQLMIERIGKKELNYIKEGIFKPLTVSKNVQELFAIQAEKVEQADPYEIASDYINDLINMYNDLPLLMDSLPVFPNPFAEIELKPTDTSYLPPDTGTGPGTVVTGVGAPATSGLNIKQKANFLFGPFDKILGGQ